MENQKADKSLSETTPAEVSDDDPLRAEVVDRGNPVDAADPLRRAVDRGFEQPKIKLHGRKRKKIEFAQFNNFD
jgi:hypothetical protein